MSRQVHNSHVAAKLALRRLALKETGWTSFAVLDLCAGEGHLWSALKRELPIDRYLPCDRKPSTSLAGTIRGEAADLAGSLDLKPFNVIDIDTFGEPWEPLLVTVGRLSRETVIFLTHGLPNIGAMGISSAVKRAVGLPVDWKIPFSPELCQYLGAAALSDVWRQATILSARRITRPRKYGGPFAVSYWALRVRPLRRRIT